MKLLIIATIATLALGGALSANGAPDGKWTGSIEKFDGEFSCQMTFTISGSNTAPSAAASVDPLYLIAKTKGTGSSISDADEIFGCTVSKAAATGAWAFDGTTKGSCGNYTIASNLPASPKPWTDADYDFNCTTTASSGSDLTGTKCYLTYDQGKLVLPAYADIKYTGVQLIKAGSTFAAQFDKSSALSASTATVVTDKECEDKSSAFNTMFAGGLALVGAAFF